MSVSPFTLTMPDVQTTNVVFASPHSGRHYSPEFLDKTVLDERLIRSSEDAFVDVLIEDAPGVGAPLIHATYPRAYLDLNRACDEMDPAVVEDAKMVAHNPRILSGLGVIPRVVANGRAIYRGKLSMAQAQERIDEVWHPYHAKLHDILDRTRETFGSAILLDMHSMPHEASETASMPRGRRPEVVLGDRFGASADGQIMDQVESVFLRAGLKVSRNAPFAGAYIVQEYGRPSRGQHAIQIEIDRGLYMNEQHVRPNGNFSSFQKLMGLVVAELSDIGRRATIPLAAE